MCYRWSSMSRIKKAVFAAITSLPEDWKKIDILVNNAGLALGRDYFEEASMDDWETMIDTNVKGLLYVSRAVPAADDTGRAGTDHQYRALLPVRRSTKKGMFIAPASSQWMPSPKSMRIDLLRHRIKVTAIHPGAADTEFLQRTFQRRRTYCPRRL